MLKKTIVLIIFALLVPNAQAAEPHLLINEIMYNPDGPDDGYEWIEIYNPTNQSVDLSEYKIETAGTDFKETFVFPDNSKIESQQYILIGEEYISQANFQTNLDLQNGGSASDGIRLVDKAGNIIDTVIYDTPNTNNLTGDINNPEIYFALNPASNKSLCRDSFQDTDNSQNDFYECTEPSPLSENRKVVTENLEDPEEQSFEETDNEETYKNSKENPLITDISNAKNQEKDTWVKIEGIVTSTPQNPSLSYIYIEDSNLGIKIYSSKKDFPKLTLGQEIKVLGKISEAFSEKKINIESKDDISITQNKEPILAQLFNIKDLDFEKVGKLVRIEGILEKQSGNTFYIKQGEAEIKISILDDSQIEKPKMKKGDHLIISGILSRHKDSLKILPRVKEDIVTQNTTSSSTQDPEVAKITSAGSSLALPYFTSLILTISTFSYLCRKNMIK